MKGAFREATASQWGIQALDFIFSKPFFRNNDFVENSGIPKQTASRITSALTAKGLLTTIRPGAGRRPALYGFYPLIEVLERDT
jgi:hypothetical protein